MSLALYSPLKVAHHPERIQAMRDGTQSAPIELQLILSDLCNQDCFFCAYRAENGLSSDGFVVVKDGVRNHNPNRMIETPKAVQIIEGAKQIGVKSIIFTGGGEPTVHPHHLDLFKIALDLQIDCALNTNGLLLRPGWEAIYPRMAYVRVSVDAGNSTEYSRIRRVAASQYDKVLENIRAIRAEIEKARSNCVLGAGYVVSPDSYKNLRRGIVALRDAGCRYVRIAAMQSKDGAKSYGSVYENCLQACRDATDLSDSGFSVVNLFEDVLGVKPDYDFCGMQQLVVYLGADLNIYRCCYTAYTDHGRIGNLENQTFAQWFHGAQKRQAIAYFDAKTCDTCPLDSENRTINYLMRVPPHVNFV